MPLKIINLKEWKRLGLPTNTTTIHLGPFYEWNKKNKNFKKPKLIATYNKKKKK